MSSTVSDDETADVTSPAVSSSNTNNHNNNNGGGGGSPGSPVAVEKTTAAAAEESSGRDEDEQQPHLVVATTNSQVALSDNRKRNNRKRRKPEKINIHHEPRSNGSEPPVAVAVETSAAEETRQSTPSLDDSNDDAAASPEERVLGNSAATKSAMEDDERTGIIKHFRSFVERNNDELDFSGVRHKRLRHSGATPWMSADLTASLATEGGGGGSFYQANNAMMDPSNVMGVNGLIPERTMRQNNWALKVWKDWAAKRNMMPETKGEMVPVVPVDIHLSDLGSLSFWLPKFIFEVRRKDKKPYPPDTLMQIASGLQRYLKQVMGRDDINFFDKYTDTFAAFREALRQRSGQLSQEQTRKYKQMKVAGLNDDELWKSSYLNANTAKGLFHVVFYYNCVEFEVTNMEEHHEMKVEQFTFGSDNDHREFIEFHRLDVNRHFNGAKRVMRSYANPEDPRCMVKLFRTYIGLVPSNGPFYRRPLQTSADSNQPRFSFNPVGINKLRETYKQLFTSDRPACMRKSGRTEPIMVNGVPQFALSTTPNTPNGTARSIEDARRSCGASSGGGGGNKEMGESMRGIFDGITERLLEKGWLKGRNRNSTVSVDAVKNEADDEVKDTEDLIAAATVAGVTATSTTSDRWPRRLSQQPTASSTTTNGSHSPAPSSGDSGEHTLILQVPCGIREVAVQQGTRRWLLKLE